MTEAKVHFDAGLHNVLATGRLLSTQALQTWMDVFGRRLPSTRPLSWLRPRLRSGRITPVVRQRVWGPDGVEPSDCMRVQALARAGHPDVRYAAGSAAHISWPDGSCDAALLFFDRQ
jgi:hypothetical protein